MSRKFKVIALSVGGKNNKVFNSKDIVDESNFASSVDELVSKGFLEEIKSSKHEKPTTKIESEKVEKSSILDELTSSNDEINIEDFSKKQIGNALKKLEIEYNSRDSKTDLWNLLMENENAISVLASM